MSVWVEMARVLMCDAHSGQRDKSGDPYIWHPTAVAEKVKDRGEIYEIVALLHDVVEDTPFTLAMIGVRLGAYPGVEKVLSALDAITKRDGETYAEFISRVNTNRIARVVKLADIEHNTDESRGYRLPDSLKQRYEKAKATLEG